MILTVVDPLNQQCTAGPSLLRRDSCWHSHPMAWLLSAHQWQVLPFCRPASPMEPLGRVHRHHYQWL